MFTRETIKFLIPTSMLSLTSNSTADREVIPLYINPQNIQISYSKNISETQTIGGYIIQYWGDKITKLTIAGTTGSGGIEAINILHNIYKSEQTQFKKVLLQRQRDLAFKIQEEQSAAQNAATGTSLSALDQVLFNGAFSNLANGVSETMDFFRDAIAGNDVSKSSPVRLLPTLSAFAVSLDMHYQGKVYRGYVESMSVTENAQSPGHFDYSIQYSSLKEFGERKNFMPWHTNPRDSSGNPKKKPTVGSSLGDNLSFPFVSAAETTSTTAKSVSRVIDDQRGTSNEIGDSNTLSRFNKIR